MRVLMSSRQDPPKKEVGLKLKAKKKIDPIYLSTEIKRERKKYIYIREVGALIYIAIFWGGKFEIAEASRRCAAAS